MVGSVISVVCVCGSIGRVAVLCVSWTGCWILCGMVLGVGASRGVLAVAVLLDPGVLRGFASIFFPLECVVRVLGFNSSGGWGSALGVLVVVLATEGKPKTEIVCRFGGSGWGPVCCRGGLAPCCVPVRGGFSVPPGVWCLGCPVALRGRE